MLMEKYNLDELLNSVSSDQTVTNMDPLDSLLNSEPESKPTLKRTMSVESLSDIVLDTQSEPLFKNPELLNLGIYTSPNNSLDSFLSNSTDNSNILSDKTFISNLTSTFPKKVSDCKKAKHTRSQQKSEMKKAHFQRRLENIIRKAENHKNLSRINKGFKISNKSNA